MAAEIPVNDVLCEAMEYLSKLGSNLRTRSENLREKKIRKDKLTNVLAVQKAADKVLLICELSKKSLANVEAGVRKVLERVDVSQASRRDGGKYGTDIKRKDDKPKYHYFDYKSRKLKIKTKISLKHYRSVKVLASKLSMAMLDEYPVYHDCKLYRKRRKELSRKTKEESGSGKDQHKRKTSESDDVPIDIQTSSTEEIEENTGTYKKKHGIKTQRRNSRIDKKKARIIDTDDSDDEITERKGRHESNSSVKEKNTVSNEKLDNKKSRIIDTDSDDQENTEKKGKPDSNISDNENDTVTNKNKLKKSLENIVDEQNGKSYIEPESKKPRISRNESEHQHVSDVVSIDSDDYPIPMSSNNDKEDHKSDSKENANTESATNSIDKGNKSDSESDSSKKSENKNTDGIKPMIKCVSLSKLLKPDVLIKDLIKSPKRLNSKKEFDVNKKNEMLQTAKKNKEDFWAKKRIEVSKFKPKKVSVHITRLPEFNTDFMIKHYLKKITKECKIIHEIEEDQFVKTVDEQPSIHTNDQHSKSRKTPEPQPQTLDDDSDDANLIAEANKVKNSLLNESDSDDDIILKSKKDSETTVDRIKDALLNSDSDQNEDDVNDTAKAQQDPKKTKEQHNKNSDDDKNTKEQDNKKSDDDKNTKEQDNINSDDDKDKNLSDSGSNIDEKSQENKKPKTTKSNPISESEAAKNVLLDKSDTENQSDKSDSNSKKDGDRSKNNSESDCPQSPGNKKTPERNLSTDKDDAKKHLLDDSPDDMTDVPLSKRKATPQSKKKPIEDSVDAKHALLRYSSDSETENKELTNTLNDIKKSLLEAMSDDENKLKANDVVDKNRSSQESSSSSDVPIKVRKKKHQDSDSSSSKKKHVKRKKRRIKSDSEDEKKDSSSDDDDKSTSSRSKMVRSKSKPGNSSGHSSDAQDQSDKDVDGLTDLRTLNKSRRRDSDIGDEAESSNSTATSKMAKTTGLIGEDILKAESSSDAASNDENDVADEDLPQVTMPGFNGGSEHLVKDDLLRESDSSVSMKDDKDDKDDSDEEERLNAKRRKANAIASSDSETGTTGKKDKDDDVRLSDFDDSDDSEVTKRTKRQKKASDSDGSGSSDARKQKKRRRIKSVNDSDASGSDSENEGKNKHGRKNIRKVMGKNQLEEATKKAAREEKERVARIAERQKMYNNLQFDESGKPDEVVLDKVVLDFDPETKEPLIAVDRGLVKKLKPHQANGIKFMWDACFESVKRIKKAKGSGCILAHCMGLGKTLQVVALTHTLLAHDSLTKVNRVLVVCPLSTVLNWVNEFKMWLKHAERDSDIDVYELSRFKQNGERAFQLSQWYEHGGVCVLGYEMFRNLSADNNKKFKKKMLKNFQEALVDPGPDLVVCDEGHLLKNEKTSLSQSMNKVRTLRRIVLTGTPLQNNLKEYYCMVQFVKPNLLGKYNEYLNRFVNPITNGQYTDSTEHDIKIMKRRSHVLHKMLDGAVQRRDYGVLAPFLPPKHEYVLFITLTEVQTKLYQFYLDNYSRRPLPGKSSGFLFPDFQSLQRIWTHPLVLKYNSERYEILQQKKRDKEEEDSEGSLVDFIDDDSTPAESSSEESFDDSSDMSDDSRKKSKKKKSSKKSKSKDKDKEKESAAASRRRGTRANPIDLDDDPEHKDDELMEVKYENPTEWWIKMVEEEELEDMRNSHKLVLLFDILRQCETIGDKLLVFSQSLYSLDLIEHFLGKVDEATQEGRIDEKLGGHVGSWSPGIDYFRLDGSTSCENRSIWCKNFNREDNPRARLFLISTRAGGLGINLVAANRVVIFDVSWNPSHDVQSIFRVYRFGQKKPCYVYRFLAMGTMEEKIYERQVTKQAISKRVIDEQQIDRHYAENDLAELYKFEAEPPTPRPIPPLPKDRLFAEMLREHEAQIYKYHEHDSLLENKEEETLSEEERKAAWEDFENEKNRPPPAPFPSPWPMANGMMPNLLAQQQQQLAYAALAAMLRKDMPNVNDNQIRDMLPMIYNANPALMQKMSEIYKYSQQMSMAPGMMAQGGMNPASGGAAMAGMGSTSGLQYEPPWQRQQQQQQQMRLQQLMAQQNQMGAAAKFYAGGLGSRDPVAMALQQQRAREIMVGGGAGRPRGRPPLQPRAPPAPSADVVNLDSD